jgi:hypothetical protein
MSPHNDWACSFAPKKSISAKSPEHAYNSESRSKEERSTPHVRAANAVTCSRLSQKENFKLLPALWIQRHGRERHLQKIIENLRR